MSYQWTGSVTLQSNITIKNNPHAGIAHQMKLQKLCHAIVRDKGTMACFIRNIFVFEWVK